MKFNKKLFNVSIDLGQKREIIREKKMKTKCNKYLYTYDNENLKKNYNAYVIFSLQLWQDGSYSIMNTRLINDGRINLLLEGDILVEQDDYKYIISKVYKLGTSLELIQLYKTKSEDSYIKMIQAYTS